MSKGKSTNVTFYKVCKNRSLTASSSTRFACCCCSSSSSYRCFILDLVVCYNLYLTDSYGQCAHVTNIIYKHHLDDCVVGQETDFIVTHNRFESAEYVMRDDVSLYVITKTHALFLQVRSPYNRETL